MNREAMKELLMNQVRDAMAGKSTLTKMIGPIPEDMVVKNSVLLSTTAEELLVTHLMLSGNTDGTKQYTDGHHPSQLEIDGERFHVFKRRFGLGSSRIKVRNTELQYNDGVVTVEQKEIRYTSVSGKAISIKMNTDIRRISEVVTVHIPILYKLVVSTFAVKRILRTDVKYKLYFAGYEYEVSQEEFEALIERFDIILQMQEINKLKEDDK